MKQEQARYMKDWSTKNRAYGRKFARDALIDSISDRITQQASDQIKGDVRESIQGRIRYSQTSMEDLLTLFSQYQAQRSGA
jgi:hypothetical protein